MTHLHSDAKVFVPGGFYWNGSDQLRQVLAVRNKQLDFIDLLAASATPQVASSKEMRAWGARHVDFHLAASIRDMLLASRMRLTTRQRELLINCFPLRPTPYSSHPPAADITAPHDIATAEVLIDRGVLASIPLQTRTAKRVRLTELCGLPLVRSLRGQQPLLDFLSS